MALALALLCLVGAGHAPVHASGAAPAATAQSPAQAEVSAQAQPPAQVQDLLKLLQDPAVKGWLATQQTGAAKAPEAASAANTDDTSSRANAAAAHIEAIRNHVLRLALAIPTIGTQTRSAMQMLRTEMNEHRPITILALVIGFLILGRGVEWVATRATENLRLYARTQPVATATQRLRVLALRLGLDLAMVAVFAVGSIVAFLAFRWPPLIKEIVLGYLIAAVIVRIYVALSRFVLAPGHIEPNGHRLRLLPMSDGAATFWHRRLTLFVAWFDFGWATIDLLAPLGYPQPTREVIAYALGIGLLLIALEMIWRRPRATTASQAETTRRVNRTAVNALLSIWCAALWLLWVAGMMGLFWLVAVAVLLPRAITVVRTITETILAPRMALAPTGEPGLPEDGSAAATAIKPLVAIYVERGIRALMIAAAILFLADKWDVDLVALTARETMATRLLRGVLSGIVIVLVADLLWQVIKTVIDRTLAEATPTPDLAEDEKARRAKLRTLLPIFRNILFVVLAVIAALTVLAALGVEIGPLIAGAGVVGVAVGFGAQSIVKDIISGMFYLLDDAFRVGEYIVCGSHKGTVESFSLRSIKLRHQRGAIYTVPFGQLGAVQNLSRDWVIDKMSVNVTYDTDLDKVKKIIREIGKELAQNPEFAPNIIQPLKMQGLDAFGDFAITVRMKMMTKPGEQFVIRRRANAMIKAAFEKNGIKFAFPTVQVSGGNAPDAATAAAQDMLESMKGPAA